MTYKLLITGGSGLLALNWAVERRHIDKIWLGLNKRQIALNKTRTIVMSDGLQNAITLIKPDIIIHTAAIANVESCEADEKSTCC